MGAHKSQEMKKAIELYATGLTRRDAANKGGVHENSLGRHEEYKRLRDLRNSQKLRGEK